MKRVDPAPNFAAQVRSARHESDTKLPIDYTIPDNPADPNDQRRIA